MARPREFNEDEVVDRAMDLFWTQGYRDTTPKQLVEATGLSRSSLYGTFGSKDGLFERALDRYLTQGEAFMRTRLAQGTAREAFTALLEAGISDATVEGGRSCLICSTSMQALSGQDHLGPGVERAQGRLTAMFAERMARGQREGEVRSDRSAVDLGRFFLTTSMGLQVLARGGATAAELREVAALALDSFLRIPS